MATQKSCILCHIPIALQGCYHDGNAGPTATSSFKDAQSFMEPVNENEEIHLINSFYSGIQIRGFSTEIVDTFLNGDGDGEHGQLSICGACRPLIQTTIERKQVLNKVENNVEKLQLELLKELNKLKVLVHQFYDDMKGVEERIGSGGHHSQYTLGSQCNTSEANLFERRIRQVIKHLSCCQRPEAKFQQGALVIPASENITKPLSSSTASSSSQQSDDDSIHSSDVEDSHGNQRDHSGIDNDNHASKTQQTPKSSPTTTPASKNSTIIRTPDFNDLHSSYHPCKTYVINKVLHRKELVLSGKPLPKKPHDGTDIEDPRDPYYIDYDPTTDSFSLDGIPITLTITSPKIFNFNCSQCLFLTGQRNSKDKISPFLEILDHVLRLHRQIFQCSYCSRICCSLTRYREHVRGHQMKYVCEICGRPLQTRKNLALHKWTHLNEQERNQAVEKCGKEPKIFKNKKDGEVFQCATCGKGFKLKGTLKNHEKIHLGEEERKRICDNCGRKVNHTSWDKHRKWHCKPSLIGEVVKFECLDCPKSFSTVEARRQGDFVWESLKLKFRPM